MATIPASDLVNVIPNVLTAGGSAIDMTGLFLTTNAQVPMGDVHAFANAADVATYFGASSTEYAAASIYFLGFDNSDAKPGSLYIAQYNTSAVGAWLRGGGALTLAGVQALGTGSLSIVVDGGAYSGSPALGSASSLSNAASIIQTALNGSLPNLATVTASGSGTTMTVTAVSSGTLKPGQTITGTGISGGTTITAQLTSTESNGSLGGKGTYTMSSSNTFSSTTVSATAPLSVTYDSISGAIRIAAGTTGPLSSITYATTGAVATGLLLTQATGAVISLGAAAASPVTFMTNLVALTNNWVGFTTLFDPDVSGFANKLLFSQWTNSQNNRYVYAAWDTDASPTTTVPATSSFGYAVTQADYSGTVLIYSPDYKFAAFLLGAMASIDFGAINGRITFSAKHQTGLTPNVTSQTVANNLRSNNYNFYGAWGTATETFQGFNPGKISGSFIWLDAYIDAIWINLNLQQALMTLLFNANSIPYNASGYAQIEAACQDVINQAVSFGAIRQGVSLSNQQAQSVNSAAGVDISSVLQTRGWYFQVLDASASVRVARSTPPCKFWYMDGGAIQEIDLTSVTIE